MGGDYSRVRFKPRNNVAGVLMQQGRVQLDSDWNEGVAAQERRQRAEMVDILGVQHTPGVSGVAVVSAQTPDAFKVEVDAGKLSIGRGRMYVDGLLAENHGGGSNEFNPILGELLGKDALDYKDQPYFPLPPSLPASGMHLAYLEVWQREWTYIHNKDMVESAVGVDTTTRLQTVWQVRLLQNVSAASCTTPDDGLTGWKELIAPSAGRLSVRAEGVPSNDDPCELPPTGGYWGLENQLYRIEIHDGGPLGTATFKWSRENASVASSVTEVISSTELRLASLGRDAMLRFKTGDWVEITNNRYELSGEGGDPARRRGLMRQITVHEDDHSISFTQALPPELADNPDLHNLRVSRWDHSGTVRDADGNELESVDSSGGVIHVPATGVWVVLEHGVQVKFDVDHAGGQFHSGDYWLTAARAAGLSVESYDNEPPRGVHRHYARLAVVTLPDSETDCRIHWPPGGCCTVNVSPGANIQAALDSLPEDGGCVCLKTGIHEITQPLHLHGSRVTLRGESLGAVVKGKALETLLQIGDPDYPIVDVVVENIRFETTDTKVMLHLISCKQVRVEHCNIIYSQKDSNGGSGIMMTDVADVVLSGNRLENLTFGVTANNPENLSIINNILIGVTGRSFDTENASLGQYGIHIQGDVTSACRIEDNRISDFWSGIVLGSNAEGSIISGNQIRRSEANITVKDTPPATNEAVREYMEKRLYAIDISAARCEIRDNRIDLRSSIWGGIRIRGSETSITSNMLEAAPSDYVWLLPVGIYCGIAPVSSSTEALSFKMVSDAVIPYHVAINNNRLLGAQTGIMFSDVVAPVIHGNHVDGMSLDVGSKSSSAGWYGIRVDDCAGARVENNEVSNVLFGVYLNDGKDNRVLGNHIVDSFFGITSVQEADLEISGNTLENCAIWGAVATNVRGNIELLNNRIANCAYSNVFPVGLGIFADNISHPSTSLMRIGSCEVTDTGISADGQHVPGRNTAGIFCVVPACHITDNQIGYTLLDKLEKLDPKYEHRALWLVGPVYVEDRKSGSMVRFGRAQVNNNRFYGIGKTHLIEFPKYEIDNLSSYRFTKTTFSNNICDHIYAYADSSNSDISTVMIWGSEVVAVGNHIASDDTKVTSLWIGNDKITLMANNVTGGYVTKGNVKPNNYLEFNF